MYFGEFEGVWGYFVTKRKGERWTWTMAIKKSFCAKIWWEHVILSYLSIGSGFKPFEAILEEL